MVDSLQLLQVVMRDVTEFSSTPARKKQNIKEKLRKNKLNNVNKEILKHEI